MTSIRPSAPRPQTDDARRFAQEIHRAGYATDPNYTKALTNLIDKYSQGGLTGWTPSETPLAPAARARAMSSPTVSMYAFPSEVSERMSGSSGTLPSFGFEELTARGLPCHGHAYSLFGVASPATSGMRRVEAR